MDFFTCVAAGLLLGHLADLFFLRFYTSERLSGRAFRCPDCRAALRARFLVPLLGYYASLGRCPDCGKTLPARAVVLPLGSAALFGASYLVFDDLGAALLGGLFATVFLTLTLTDLDRRLLPNRIIYPATLLAIGLSWTWPDSSAAQIIAGGIAAIIIAFLLILLSIPFGGAKAFGMGDVKMIVLIGFVVGLPSVIVGVFVGTLVAAGFALLALALRVRHRTDYIPHGPFLAIGAVVALFWGSSIWSSYTGG
jgi:prepilin signal peptidase PulO-like enzyme (type II secretory pathway)